MQLRLKSCPDCNCDKAEYLQLALNGPFHAINSNFDRFLACLDLVFNVYIQRFLPMLDFGFRSL